jgi:hypothetical protein
MLLFMARLPAGLAEPSGLRTAAIGGPWRGVLRQHPHARSSVHVRLPVPPAERPVVDFSRYSVVAFFGGNSIACEPYDIRRVVDCSDRIVVEVDHPRQGHNCLCIAIAVAAGRLR